MPRLTSDEVKAIYDEIGQMHVKVDADASKGLAYVKERLTLCRAMQDRCNELHLKANRALSEVWSELLVRKAEHDLTPSAVAKQRINELEEDKQQHNLLIKMIRAQSSLLSRTSMDIRLLADLTKEQIKLGEIDPKDAPELISQVDPKQALEDLTGVAGHEAPSFYVPETADADRAVLPPFLAPPPPTLDSGATSTDLGFPQASGPVGETVSLDDPVPAVPVEERMRVPDIVATPFDELFLNLEVNGGRNPF